jgi:hypothetical protein
MLSCALVVVQVTTLQPIDESLCLVYVSAKRCCFQPQRARQMAAAGVTLAFHPG